MELGSMGGEIVAVWATVVGGLRHNAKISVTKLQPTNRAT
jgi:hypothetical protein